MSATGDDEPRLREVAYRLFATEFDDADFSYSESDEERAPNYVVTPTGARVNRLFAVGVLTEIESVNQEVLRARIADPTGAFVVYAGQYQPEALAFLESAEPPLFVAVTGKARTFEPEDSDRVYTSIRPETISEVEATTRDRWVVQAAEQTLERIDHLASAKRTGVVGDQLRESLEASGLTESQAAGIALALDHYGTTGDYLQALRETALDAARVVAGERDEARGVSMRPGDGSDDPLPTLADLDVEVTEPAASEAETAEPDTQPEAAEPDAEPSESPTTPTEESGEAAAPTQSESVEPATTEGAEPDSTGAADATGETASEPDPTETAEASASESAPEPESTTATEVESSTATETVDESPTETVEEPSSEPSTEAGDESSQAASSEATPAQTDAGSETGDDDLGDFEPEFELDEDEREQIEAEYGTEFQSGTDVDDPGEADIETPDPEEVADAAAGTDAAADAATESAPAEPTDDAATADSASASVTSADAEPATSETASEPDGGDDAATDVDLEDAVMTAMKDLDDGDGADREELVASVVDQHGADPGAVEDAIQDALMGGRCYEPEDGKLTPI